MNMMGDREEPSDEVYVYLKKEKRGSELDIVVLREETETESTLASWIVSEETSIFW